MIKCVCECVCTGHIYFYVILYLYIYIYIYIYNIHVCDIVLDFLKGYSVICACRQFYHVLYPFKSLQSLRYSFSFSQI